ncbi:hypothetical protein M413DRAFT_440675, partial [Hebeloma cylindrosporum]
MPTTTSNPNVVDEIIKSFQLPDDRLTVITQKILEAFKLGTEGNPNGLAMTPTFVTSVPNGTEKGTFLTLDFESAAFRVSQVKLDGKRNLASADKIVDLSAQDKTGEATAFFDLVADSVKGFLAENGIQGSTSNPLPLGVTFGFPVQKTGIKNAKLAAWTKGFSVQNAVGKDVSTLLQDALDRKRIPVKCVSVVNDTAAIFLAQSYLSGGCVLAAIFGVGTNGAFPEDIAKIKKLHNTPSLSTTGKMILNTEWGAFDNQRNVLPRTPYDNKLHRESLRPGFQSFEKMVSWMYLGEIARNIFVFLIDQSPPALFGGKSTPALNAQFGFDSYYLTLVEQASSLADIKAVLVEHLGFKSEDISDTDANIVRAVSIAVTTRSARLAACAVAAGLVY